MLLALERLTHLVKTPHILVLHLLSHCVIRTFTSFVSEVHIGEVRVVDVHLSDGSQELSAVKSRFRLNK